MTYNPHRASEYIKNLEIGSHAEVQHAVESLKAAVVAAKTDADGNAAFVNNGSLIDTVDNLPQQQQNDILNWFLLGQLAANKKVDRINNPTEWYNQLTSILNSIGLLVSSFDITQVTGSQLGFNVGETVQNILQTVLTDKERAFLKHTIDVLPQGSNANSNKIFNQSSSDRSNANFQAGTAKADKSLNISLQLGAFFFHTSSNITDVIGFQFGSSSVTFNAGNTTLLLAKGIADAHRDEINAKLGGNIASNISGLDI